MTQSPVSSLPTELPAELPSSRPNFLSPVVESMLQQAAPFDPRLTGAVSVLTELGLIAVSGVDAATFLHSQLTNDIAQLGENTVRLAGYCSPKGRLLATMLVWNSDHAILLQLPRTLQATVQKRLQMFVMRAKATLLDINQQKIALGFSGVGAEVALQHWFPNLPPQPYSKIDNAHGSLLRLADDGGARYQWIIDHTNANTVWPQLCATLNVIDSSAWRLGDIRAGVAQISAATQEKFVPQMINFELVGGVSFKKGCYPGQEIVARSQYLGKLKRRAMLAMLDPSADESATDFSIAAGTELFSSADPLQPCGMVINAERDRSGSVHCLVEIKLAAVEADSVHLGTPQGPALHFAALPYVLADPQ